MKLNFTKMNGLGNDFIVIDARQDPFQLNANQIQFLADRRRGIGFDQILVLETATDPRADFAYRIFNADGQEVGQCGNGARCLFAYLLAKKIHLNENVVLQTANRFLTCYREHGVIGVELGEPLFNPPLIPLAAKKAAQYQLIHDDEPILFSALSVGNPHAVIIVKDVEQAIEPTALALQQSNLFPEGVNVGFMQIINPDLIRLRVYERGAGETLACGSGAAAAVIAGIMLKQLNSHVTVQARGGESTVTWQPGHAVHLLGPTELVFDGQIELSS